MKDSSDHTLGNRSCQEVAPLSPYSPLGCRIERDTGKGEFTQAIEDRGKAMQEESTAAKKRSQAKKEGEDKHGK